MQTIFNIDDVVLFLLLGIATMFNSITTINQYLYTLFLIIGITVGIIKIIQALRKKK